MKVLQKRILNKMALTDPTPSTSNTLIDSQLSLLTTRQRLRQRLFRLRHLLGRHMLLANTLTCMGLLGIGDVLQQTLGKQLMNPQHEGNCDLARSSMFWGLGWVFERRLTIYWMRVGWVW
jgi:hypothetical protein